MSNNRVLFCGDPHGQFKGIIDAVHQYHPEAIVLLGDHNLKMPLEHQLSDIISMTQVYWIPGNHDFNSKTEHGYLFHSALANNELHLKVAEVDGLRIAGLGGTFKGRVWMPGDQLKWLDQQHWASHQPQPVKKIPLPIQGAIWHHEYLRMKNKIKADILVCHEAPSSHRLGFVVIDELAEAIGAKQIFHGHHHIYYKQKLPNAIEVTGVAIGSVVNLAGEPLNP